MAARTAAGVAGADQDAQIRRGQPELAGRRVDLGERPLEILLDVRGEGLERDVDDARLAVLDAAGRRRLPEEPVDRDEEGGQRLARAGGRGDQRVLAAGDRGPAAAWGSVGPSGNRRSNQIRTAGWEKVSASMAPESTSGSRGCPSRGAPGRLEGRRRFWYQSAS